MGPKTVKKQRNRLWFAVILIVFGLALSLAALYISGYFDQAPQLPTRASISNIFPPPKANTAIQIASRSASPSALVKPKMTIPQSYGRSVHVPILTYHYIRVVTNPADTAGLNLSITPDKFDAQLGYLVSQGFNAITFDTLYAALKGRVALPTKPIILTFDDGYIDFYTTVYPILRKYNLHAVSFIPTGLMNQGYYMSWAQIKEIDAFGLVSFQAHSVSHANLTTLDPTRLTYQIVESKKVLEANLGKTVNTFAYPYGASDEKSWQAVKQAGFVGAVGTWFGTIESEGTIYDMPRVKIAGSVELPTYMKLVAN